MRTVRIALAVGLALMALALVLTLSGSPATLAAPRATAVDEELVNTQRPMSICQAGETLPQGTTALRLSLKALIGPRITVKVLASGRVVAFGERGPGWTASAVTVPVRRTTRAIASATVCLAFAVDDETVEIAGEGGPRSTAAVTNNGQALPGRVKIEYLRPGTRSWWSLALATARHLGLGRAWAGTWVAALVLVLMAAVLALTVWRLLSLARAPRGRVPAAAWACALVALINTAAWSFVMPPFQVTDEADHFAYVQQLAQNGKPPSSGRPIYSAAEKVALTDLHQPEVRLRPEYHTIFALAEQRELEAALVQQTHTPQAPTNAAGLATGEPPLYYALQAIPYSLVGGTVLERLVFMRLLSALMAGVTALFAFLFVREAVGGVAWAWTVGGLAVALAPLLGFASSGVDPDALLFAVSAALFYCLARAFRRGFTGRIALAIGGLAGVDFVTKLNFIGLLPGVLLGLLVLTLRTSRSSPRTSRSSLRDGARSLALGLIAAAIPVLALITANSLFGLPALGPTLGNGTSTVEANGTLIGEIVYIWQLYLPRLPGMARDFVAVFAPRQIWFDGYVGLYGWLDTTFPTWVYTAALVPATLLAMLCLRTLIATRATLRRRASELCVYATIAAGLLLLLGVTSYREFPGYGASFGEARYLLPLIPLLGAAIALGARGAGRRYGPAIGALIVVLAFAHDIFSQLQVIARYYN
jgi:4-amino-4-deoxy-L-arabinose transferase-like glycosyltransferase